RAVSHCHTRHAAAGQRFPRHPFFDRLGIAFLLRNQQEYGDTDRNRSETTKEFIMIPVSKPLVNHLFTADPSAHVFDGKIYIYPSHDIDAGIPFDDLGSHFAMEDYHVFSMEHPGAEAVDHGVALHI